MKPIKFSLWRLLLPPSVVAAVVMLAVLTTSPTKTSVLVRYIGPPLPDGSRVTFLHPASVSKFLASPGQKPPLPWIVQDVQMAKPTVMNAGEAIWYRLPIAGRMPARDLGVGVLVTNVSPIYLVKKLIISGRTRRQYVEQTLPGYGSVSVDEVDIVDASRGRQYAFRYQSLGAQKSAAFTAQEAAIVNSFQVLPPGAAPPVP